MKALLIYKNSATRWIQMAEYKPGYFESVRPSLSPMQEEGASVSDYLPKQIYFEAICRPEENFVIYLEKY